MSPEDPTRSHRVRRRVEASFEPAEAPRELPAPPTSLVDPTRVTDLATHAREDTPALENDARGHTDEPGQALPAGDAPVAGGDRRAGAGLAHLETPDAAIDLHDAPTQLLNPEQLLGIELLAARRRAAPSDTPPAPAPPSAPDAPAPPAAVSDRFDGSGIEGGEAAPVQPPTRPESAEPAAQAEPPAPPTEATMERSRQLWVEREPDDPSDPVPHVLLETLVGEDGIQIVAASRRGLGHAHDGKYREDHFALALLPAWALVAVADGTGSVPLARVGARVAARAAINYLETALRQPLPASAPLQTAVRAALAGAQAHALARLVDTAIRRERPVDELSTTLILLAVQRGSLEPHVGVAQVGDGGIAARVVQGACTILGQADHGRFGGESSFLTSQGVQLTWDRRAHVYRSSEQIRTLVVATDGVFDDFTEPFGELPRLFDAVEPLIDGADAQQRLSEWLTYERRGSFDDRTLVVVSLPCAAPGSRRP